MKMRERTRKISAGAILSALTVVVLLLGSFFEILDMTCAAAASFAVLVTYIEFGFPTSICVYITGSVLSFIFSPLSSAVIYFALLMGYFPVFKFFADRFLKNRLFLSAAKFLVFNAGFCAVVFVFVKMYGMEALLEGLDFGFVSKKALFIFVFAVLNIFLLVYDKLIFYVAVIYKNVLRKRIFPKK